MNFPSSLSFEHARLVRKLETIGTLTANEKQAIGALPLRLKNVGENHDLIRDGETPPECCLIVEGFVCRYKLVGDGQRQIMAFHLPGDIPDLQSLHLRRMDHSLSTLTPGRVAYIAHAALHEIAQAFPGIGAILWRDTLINAAGFREWLSGVGRRTAHQRIAHVICEIFVRLKSLGLTDGDGFDLPVTQAELGDAMGLSSVHVNRVLQDLRADGLIASRGKFVAILDWPGVQQTGDFDPAYLHLRADPP